MLWVLSSEVFAQVGTISLPYTRYTVADGLSQMQVRTLFVDKVGYTWIGTQGGISGFDGSQMRSYKGLGTISEGKIVSLIRGSQNIYGTTLTEIFSFDGVTGKIVPVQYTLTKPRVLFEDGNEAVWILSGTDVLILKKGNVEPIETIYPKLKSIQFVNGWGDPEWDKCYFLDRDNRFYSFNPVSGEISVDSTTFSPSDVLGYTSNRSASVSNVIIYKTGKGIQDIYRLVADNLQHVASKSGSAGVLKQLTENAPHVYVDLKDNISTLFALKDSVYQPDLLPIFNHTRFSVEHNQKVYVGTDEGLVVVHFDGLETFNFDQCDYPWSVVPTSNTEIYIGCYKTGVYRVNENGATIKHYPFPASTNGNDADAQILSNYQVAGRNIYFGSNMGYYIFNQQNQTLSRNDFQTPVEAFAFDEKGKLLIIGSNLVYWIDPITSSRVDSFSVSDTILAGAWINDIVMLKDHTMWVAGDGGIERIDPDTRESIIFSGLEKGMPCTGAVSLCEGTDGQLWIGGTCGLLFYDAHEDRIVRVLPELIYNRVNQITILPGHRLVCASNNDLYLLDISSTSPSVIAVFNTNNGLNLNEPSENGISVSNNRYVWLPSVTGIQRLDLNAVTSSFEVAKLKLIEVNDHPVSLHVDLEQPIPIDGNTALLDLSVIDHSGRRWQFQYSLDSIEFSPWQSSPELLVAGLKHGINKVWIRASWDTTDPSSFIETNAVLTASIPFLSRSSTQRMLLGLTALLVLLFVISLIRAQRSRGRENKLRADFYRNRLRTIQAYLNPHFLFNTLTSIQDHILHQDAKAGNDMIVRLSRVFRKVLDTGKFDENKIPLTRLSEELALIQDIVFLNNQQISTPVDFALNIDTELREADPLIPPMLIQPFVENAFKHAFTETDLNKTIKVSITSIKSGLSISIMDNGIGMEGLTQSPDNPSMGIQLAKERMDILNSLNIANSIDIRRNEPHGTCIEIQIKHFT